MRVLPTNVIPLPTPPAQAEFSPELLARCLTNIPELPGNALSSPFVYLNCTRAVLLKYLCYLAMLYLLSALSVLDLDPTSQA
jgi:hypothetical protein